jgi:hypothetical protein
MSPEQVLADPLELDTRSDVYALGVILYELLSGRLPYSISKKLHEALHTIREEDPARLSSINRAFRGDIETIAAKALEKDKTRRYASAAELAADISHYLKDEPIVAQPPTTVYQLKKFARRNKALVVGIAAVFVVLLGGVVVSTWLAVRASRAQAAATRDRDRASEAERTATVARDEALDARGKAVEAEGQARLDRDKAIAEKQRADIESATAKAVSEFLQKNLFEQVTGGAQQSASLDLSVSGALDRTAARIEGTFDKQPLVEAGVREAVANAYTSLALYDKAAPQLEHALDLRRRAQDEEDADILRTMSQLAVTYANQRKFADSTNLLGRALDTHRRRFGRDHADTLKYAFQLAAIYSADGKPAKAEPFALEAMEGRQRTLGPGHRDTLNAAFLLESIYAGQQKFPQAVKVATTAYESSRRAWGENHPLTLAAKSTLQGANLRAAPNAAVDRTARNERFENAARALSGTTATSLPEMIDLAARRATVAINQGQLAQAEAVLLEALDAARRAGQEEPNLTAILAGTYALGKKYSDAEATLRKLLENPVTAKDMNPTLVPFALRSLGMTYKNDGKFAEAEPHLLKLVQLVLVSPGETVLQTRVDMFQLAENYVGQRKYVDAEREFTRLLDVQRRVTGPDAINTVVTISNIGWVRLQQKRYAEAERTFRDAAAILHRSDPSAWERFNVDSMLGTSLAAQKKFEEAESLLISGFNGMGSSRPTTNQNMASRFTREQAGEAVIQLYAEWGKPEKQSEWIEKLK